MTVKLLTEHHLEFLSVKGGSTDSSESTLVKMPHFWKSQITAQINSHMLLWLRGHEQPERSRLEITVVWLGIYNASIIVSSFQNLSNDVNFHTRLG